MVIRHLVTRRGHVCNWLRLYSAIADACRRVSTVATALLHLIHDYARANKPFSRLYQFTVSMIAFGQCDSRRLTPFKTSACRRWLVRSSYIRKLSSSSYVDSEGIIAAREMQSASNIGSQPSNLERAYGPMSKPKLIGP